MPQHHARILPHLPLHQGSVDAARIDGASFDTAVLCAEELRMDRDLGALPPHVRLIDAGINDAELSPREAFIVENAAARVVRDLAEGRRVLVFCYAGRNRSGLVVGLALRRLGLSGPTAVGLVRAARGPRALSNASFVRYLTA